MELRWYWRVLQRQWRIIWGSFIVVALIAGAYTAYSYAGSRYKGQATVEFTQLPPTYFTQNLPTDPAAAALANAAAACTAAKQYTQGADFFQAMEKYVQKYDHVTVDWKTIRAGLGAFVSNDRYLVFQYSASTPDKATQMLQAAMDVLQATPTKVVSRTTVSLPLLPGYTPFLDTYNSTLLGANKAVYEPPIKMAIFDNANAPQVSLSSTGIGWLEKALVGFVLGLALAVLWEYLDETIHDDQDVRSWMQLPTLGVIPELKGR